MTTPNPMKRLILMMLTAVLMATFDQVDVLNKAVQIYMSTLNMDFKPEGMNEAQMNELREMVGL